MGRRMVDNLRAVGLKYLLHAVGIANRSDQHHQIQPRIFPAQLLLNIIGIILIDVHDNQSLRMMSGDLPAKLTADRASASRNHNHGIAYIIYDLVYIRPDRLPAQQIFYLHFLQGRHRDLPIDQLVGSRYGPKLTSRLLADIQYLLPGLPAGGRNCEDDLINSILRRRVHDLVPAPYDRNPPQKLAVTARLIIDDASNLQIDVLADLYLLQDHVGRRARPDDHHMHSGLPTQNVLPLGIQDPQNTVTEPNHAGHAEQKNPKKHIIASGHIPSGEMT